MKIGWEVHSLASLCKIKTGKKDVNQGNPEGEFPFFTCASSHTYSDTYSFDAEAILIAGNGDVGKVSYYSGKFEAYQRTYVLTNFNKLDPKLLFYFLDGELKAKVSKQKLGNTMPYIKIGMLNDFQVPVPPQNEQQKLLLTLEEAFEGIAVAKANAERNLQNARALFESYLESVFTERGDGWEEKRLGDLVVFRNGINFTQSSRGKTIKIVGVKDFQKNFFAPLENLETIVTDGKLPDFDLLKENDLLFVRSNGNQELIGRCLLAGPVNDEITHSGFTIRARLTEKGISPRFLCHFLKSQKARRQMIESGTGTNIKSLSQGVLASLEIPLPQLELQKRITSEIEVFKNETQRLESIYRQKIAALDELKKSLLHEAFSGRL